MDDVAGHGWSEHVQTALTAAGWTVGRRVDVEIWRDVLRADSGFQMHEAAATFLAEFGGLTIHSEGSGRRIARASVVFDPMLCSGMRPYFLTAACPAPADLYPLGEGFDGDAQIAIDADGQVYLLADPTCLPYGRGADAVANLLEGNPSGDLPPHLTARRR